MVSEKAGLALIASMNSSAEAIGFSEMDRVSESATQGPLTPDHVIRTKRIPLIINTGDRAEIDQYATEYHRYYCNYKNESLTSLDPAPRWAVWPGHGTLAFGKAVNEVKIIADINRHTVRAIQWAEKLGGWKTLPADKIFDVEYWDLEQAKLKEGGMSLPFRERLQLLPALPAAWQSLC